MKKTETLRTSLSTVPGCRMASMTGEPFTVCVSATVVRTTGRRLLGLRLPNLYRTEYRITDAADGEMVSLDRLAHGSKQRVLEAMMRERFNAERWVEEFRERKAAERRAKKKGGNA